MAGIGIWQLTIFLVIVFLLFSTKRQKNVRGDLADNNKKARAAFADIQILHKYYAR